MDRYDFEKAYLLYCITAEAERQALEEQWRMEAIDNEFSIPHKFL